MIIKNAKIINLAKQEKGFALVFALLIVGIVVSIGISVFEIFYIESALTKNINESQHAFYAADTAMECIFYWDIKNTPPITETSSKTITCNNETKTIGGALTSGFQLLMNNGTCVNVTLNINAATKEKTLESLGRSRYNATTNNCDTNMPRRAERGLESKYY